MKQELDMRKLYTARCLGTIGAKGSAGFTAVDAH